MGSFSIGLSALGPNTHDESVPISRLLWAIIGSATPELLVTVFISQPGNTISDTLLTACSAVGLEEHGTCKLCAISSWLVSVWL